MGEKPTVEHLVQSIHRDEWDDITEAITRTVSLPAKTKHRNRVNIAFTCGQPGLPRLSFKQILT